MEQRTDSVLVIVVTYNAMRWARKCFDSVLASNVKCDLFIVDNCSTDGTQEFIRQNYPSAIFTQSKENLGFGRANNLGLKYALDNGYDYCYLLNQDAWIFPDTIGTLIEVNRKHPEYGILSPMQMEANMKNLDNGFCAALLNPENEDGKTLESDLYFNTLRDAYSVKEIQAAHWLISRKCLETVGGFSPTFKHYAEDCNYTNRASYHKIKTVVVPTARAVHDRELRPFPTAKKIYFVHTFVLWNLSAVYNRPKCLSARIAFWNMKALVKYRSFEVVKNAMKELVEIWTIRQNRKASMNVGPTFLS